MIASHCGTRSSLILVTRTGGWGGRFASVRAIGVTGQQQQAKTVSADDDVRGGAGGCLRSRGGGTNPGSPVPSPPSTVPTHNVAASAAVIDLLVLGCIRIPPSRITYITLLHYTACCKEKQVQLRYLLK